MTKKFDDQLSDYWLQNYCDNVCTLCGNRGVIDTRNRAVSGAGHIAGRLNYCICPNGRVLRAGKADMERIAERGR